MVSLYLTKCHKILDHQQVEVAVVIVDSIHKNIISVVYGKLEVLKILMSVISGEKDILKDDMEYFIYHFLD